MKLSCYCFLLPLLCLSSLLQAQKATSLSEALKNPQSVRELELRGQSLKTLPAVVLKLSSLESLDLSYNQFTSLPEVLLKMKWLKKVNLSGNGIGTLPESMLQMEQLEELTIGYSMMLMPATIVKRSPPTFLFRMPSLKQLNISNWALTDLPEVDSSKLFLLDVSHNSISRFPATLLHTETLKVLNIGNNNFTSLPDSFINCRQLTRLLANDNRLTDLPASVSALQLIELNTGANTFLKSASLFKKCCGIRSLQKLNFSVASLISIPIGTSYPPHLTELDLSYNQLTVFPDSICHLPLQKLYLSKNQIKSLPACFSQLKSLEYLDLGYNQFTALPDIICSITSLTNLDVSFNKLMVSYPKNINMLQSLRYLNLKQTKIGSAQVNQLNWLIPDCRILL